VHGLCQRALELESSRSRTVIRPYLRLLAASPCTFDDLAADRWSGGSDATSELDPTDEYAKPVRYPSGASASIRSLGRRPAPEPVVSSHAGWCWRPLFGEERLHLPHYWPTRSEPDRGIKRPRL